MECSNRVGTVDLKSGSLLDQVVHVDQVGK